MSSPESKPFTIEFCVGDSSTDYEVTLSHPEVAGQRWKIVTDYPTLLKLSKETKGNKELYDLFPRVQFFTGRHLPVMEELQKLEIWLGKLLERKYYKSFVKSVRVELNRILCPGTSPKCDLDVLILRAGPLTSGVSVRCNSRKQSSLLQ